MHTPTISIGLPIYNNSKTILSCIKSIFAQSFTDWELIIVNDGSTDDSYEIIKDINDPRVKIINEGTNRGLIYRLNQIVMLSKGKYVARMDGDDIMHPLRLEKQIAYLKANADIDIVDTAVISIGDDTMPEGIRRMEEIPNEYKMIVKANQLTHPAVIGKREWFEKHKYDDDYLRAEDYELWCRTFPTSKFSRIIEPLHFLREGNISISNYLKTGKTVRKIYLKYGVKCFGYFKTYFFILQSLSKSWLYILFGFFNCQFYLSRKRNKVLSQAEKEEFSYVLSMIEKTFVPRNK